jgi:hypothetical protein
VIPLLAIPLAAKISIATIVSAALFCSGLYMGHQIGVNGCYEATIEAQSHTVETGVKQAVVSDNTVTKYVDRVQIVQGKSRTIIKEIPIYVKDDTCNLSGSFRLLHDSAVNNELPDPTRIIDAPTVAVETVAETIGANYGICHQNKETLTALQDWVREQSAIR